MTNDKRRHPRRPMDEDTIYYASFDTADSAERDRIHFLGTLTNISASGVGIRVLFEHQPGDQVYFEGIDGEEKPRPAVVRWLKPRDRSDWFDMGVEFLQ